MWKRIHCLCFLIECPNYLNQFCIVLIAALSCKKEFFLNTEIFYKISENYWWGNCPTCPTGSDAPEGTPLYEISKYIANILKPYGKLKEQDSHTSKSFSTLIRQQKINLMKLWYLLMSPHSTPALPLTKPFSS